MRIGYFLSAAVLLGLVFCWRLNAQCFEEPFAPRACAVPCSEGGYCAPKPPPPRPNPRPNYRQPSNNPSSSSTPAVRTEPLSKKEQKFYDQYHSALDQASAAWSNKNYQQALDLYLAAQRMLNTNVDQGNVAILRGIVAEEAGNDGAAQAFFNQAHQVCEICWLDPAFLANYQKWVADYVQEQVASLQQRVNSIDASVSPRVAELEAKAEAMAIQPTGAGSALFGIPVNGPLPALAPSVLSTTTMSSNLQDLISIAQSSQDAAQIALSHSGQPLSQTDLDLAKALSNCGIDGVPCEKVDRVAYPRPEQNPNTADLASHIPAVGLGDEQIQKRLREYAAADAFRKEEEQKAADVTAQIKAGGDKEVLGAYLADLNGEAQRAKKQEDDSQSAIQNRMANLGLTWSEQAPKPPAKQ